MKICVLAYGSRGDVQPVIALSARLAGRGHEVRLVAPMNFAKLAAGRGFDFAALPIDMMEELKSPEAAILFSGGASLVELIRWWVKTTKKWMDVIAPIVLQASEDAELVVATGLMYLVGGCVAEIRKIPCVYAVWQPQVAAADFSFACFERAPPPMPGFVNRWIFLAFEQAVWLALRPTLRSTRNLFRLPPAGFKAPLSVALKRGAPLLLAYSGEFLPRSREWPVNMETTGWWFLDEGAGWTPPPALEAFLAAGPPPVYVGFGSMAFKDSQATLRAALAAIKKVGARAILSAGWGGGLTGEAVPDTVFAIDEAPHDWLFPRMAVIVHHGGAGTVGAAVRAGKPSVVTPFIVDQFPWARLLEARGVAPAPIPHRTLTAEALGDALTSALHDEAMRRRAEDLGERVRAENGVGRAVAVIERVGHSKRA